MKNNKKNLKAAATVKNTVIGIMIGFLFSFSISSLTTVYGNTEELEEEKKNQTPEEIVILDTDNYTESEIWGTVEDRKGKIVIVVEHGIVLNDIGDGQGNLGYIKYDPEEFAIGTKVKTYLIYNPVTNYWDDIIERYDYTE